MPHDVTLAIGVFLFRNVLYAMIPFLILYWFKKTIFA